MSCGPTALAGEAAPAPSLFGPIVIAGLALNRWHSKLTVLYVVLGCGLIGIALQLTVL